MWKGKDRKRGTDWKTKPLSMKFDKKLHSRNLTQEICLSFFIMATAIGILLARMFQKSIFNLYNTNKKAICFMP